MVAPEKTESEQNDSVEKQCRQVSTGAQPDDESVNPKDVHPSNKVEVISSEALIEGSYHDVQSDDKALGQECVLPVNNVDGKSSGVKDLVCNGGDEPDDGIKEESFALLENEGERKCSEGGEGDELIDISQSGDSPSKDDHQNETGFLAFLNRCSEKIKEKKVILIAALFIIVLLILSAILISS